MSLQEVSSGKRELAGTAAVWLHVCMAGNMSLEMFFAGEALPAISTEDHLGGQRMTDGKEPKSKACGDFMRRTWAEPVACVVREHCLRVARMQKTEDRKEGEGYVQVNRNI